tara:strand:+ start:2158 stop:2445 length:288 start_codon:yes stop_codon:yes gene_type:complete
MVEDRIVGEADLSLGMAVDVLQEMGIIDNTVLLMEKGSESPVYLAEYETVHGEARLNLGRGNDEFGVGIEDRHELYGLKGVAVESIEVHGRRILE